MSYYPTIDEDLQRAREILATGAAVPGHGGFIAGLDVPAAYWLLDSFVAEIERLKGAASPATPALEQAIQKLADQFSRWGKSKTNTNDSTTDAWSFVAEQLKKALADVARLPTSHDD